MRYCFTLAFLIGPFAMSNPAGADMIISTDPIDFIDNVDISIGSIKSLELRFGDAPSIGVLQLSTIPGTDMDFTAAAPDPAAFLASVANLTNGIDNSVDLAIGFANGIYIRHLTESEFFTRDSGRPDFLGGSISGIHVLLNTLTLEHYENDNHEDALRVSFAADFVFYGTPPVPAPGAASLVLMGLGVLLSKRPARLS